MASTEAGHHEGRVYLHQDGRLVVPSSAKIWIEGSTSGKLNSGAGIINRNVGYTTSRTTEVSGGVLSNDGITVILTTAVGTLMLGHPVKGAQKTIVWGTTAAVKVKVRLTQTVDGSDVKLGALGGKVAPDSGAVCVFASSDCYKTHLKALKYAFSPSVQLLGYSTSRWILMNSNPLQTTDAKGGIVIATST